jgi:diguanylate cyclase (GGDEF)-like protein/PAS domain S-box-containing protein
MLKTLFAAILALILSLPAITGAAAEALTLGVFAFRPKEIVQAKYQPLVDYLNRKAPDANIHLQVMSQAEIETALKQGRLDLVFTNPSHFVLLRSKNHLSGAIATLVTQENDQATSMLAGVILAPAGRDDIRTLADLKGKRIAIPGVQFLGGFQAQAYELMQAGIQLPQDATLEKLETHDAVIKALLSGQADAGFVRTGVIEAITAAGGLPANRLKIINLQKLPYFPFQASTRLYPEWAFAASPRVNDHTVIQIARALYDIQPDSAVARAAGIHGFTVPGDYLPVENLARVLRLPPFDGAPAFTPNDVWHRYRIFILAGVVTGGLILALTVTLLLNRRRSQQSEQRFRAIFDGAQDGIVLADAASKRLIGANRRFCEMTGHTRDELTRMSVADIHPAADLPYVIGQFELQTKGALTTAPTLPVLRKDGSVFYANVSTSLLELDGRPCMAGFFRDVTERRTEAEARRQARAEIDRLSQRNQLLLNSAGEGIYGVDTTGRITFINPAALKMLGLNEHEALGQNAHALFHHCHPDGSAYAEDACPLAHVLQDGLHREIEDDAFIRKNGEHFPVHLVATAMIENEHLVGAEIVFQDISQRKRLEAELIRLATTDALTGIANRRNFIEQLEKEMARIQRVAEPAAVLMLDLDHFKQVNDNHGHAAGDAVLQAFARAAQSTLRKIDLIGRLGGEEFAILLPETGLGAAHLFAERLRLHITTMSVENGGVSIQITVSIGLTEMTRADTSADAVLARADQALYQAKADGRNQVAAG